MPYLLTANRRILVPAVAVTGVRDPLDRPIRAPHGSMALHAMNQSLMQSFSCIRFLPSSRRGPSVCTLVCMPANGSTAREDLLFLQQLAWFGQDMMLVTEYVQHTESSGVMTNWKEEHLSDYADWRRRMQFLLHDLNRDAAAEVDHLRTVREDGARNIPTMAFFWWKAWSWDIVVPMTFRVRHDIARVVQTYLCNNFSWDSNPEVLRNVMNLCIEHRRFIPRRTVKVVQGPSTLEALAYLRTQRDRDGAENARTHAIIMNAVWDGIEHVLVQRMRVLCSRFNDLAGELLHVRAMLQELRLPPSDDGDQAVAVQAAEAAVSLEEEAAAASATNRTQPEEEAAPTQE